MIGGFKTVNLSWVNKIAMIGYTWVFVYESARSYEGRMDAAPESEKFWGILCGSLEMIFLLYSCTSLSHLSAPATTLCTHFLLRPGYSPSTVQKRLVHSQRFRSSLMRRTCLNKLHISLFHS